MRESWFAGTSAAFYPEWADEEPAAEPLAVGFVNASDYVWNA